MKHSRGVEADVIEHIGEVELRRLYAQEACSSMFEYCRRVLRLRENEAYLRITVARLAREFPMVLDMLRDGRLHLSGVARLAPHLTSQNAHKEPFARGGGHSPSNLALMCKAHNLLLAEQDYGRDVMARFRAAGRDRTVVPVDVYGDRISLQSRWSSPG